MPTPAPGPDDEMWWCTVLTNLPLAALVLVGECSSATDAGAGSATSR